MPRSSQSAPLRTTVQSDLGVTNTTTTFSYLLSYSSREDKVRTDWVGTPSYRGVMRLYSREDEHT